MSEYVFGIDTGATKSHLALFNTEGILVDFGYWGPLNHELFPGSYAQFRDEFGKFVMRYLSKNGISINQIAYSVHGIAGVDTKSQHETISNIIAKTGFNKFTLVNDAFLGVPAGIPSGIGICALNGTGSTLAGITKEGKMLQIGGVGYVSDDRGGGARMGRRVISIVYSELFRRGRATSMTPVLLEKLGITSKFDFVDRVYEKIDDGSFNIGTTQKLLFEAVMANDEVAKELLMEIAVSYANGISGIIEDLKFNQENEINIVFAGSVFVKGEHPIMIDAIKEKVNLDNPGCRINYKLLDVPPVAGAVNWALNTLYGKGVFYEKVCSQLRDM